MPRIFWNLSINGESTHPPSSAPSSERMGGTTSSAARTVLCLMPSWIGSHMILIKSRSKASIRTKTSPCGKFTVWIRILTLSYDDVQIARAMHSDSNLVAMRVAALCRKKEYPFRIPEHKTNVFKD